MKLLFTISLSLLTLTAAAQTATPWETGSYVYDGAGNIKSIGTEQFRYDALSRLRSGTAGTGRSQSATYDAYGNILTLTTDGVTLTFGVNPATNRLTQTSANVFGTYDDAGRVTVMAGVGNTFTYDGADTVMKSTVEGISEVHLYSATDERVASVTIAGGVETRSDWTVRDTTGRILRRLEKNGTQWSWKEDYIYRGEQLLAAEVDTPAQTLHFHPDHLGTPRLITGNGGMKISLHTYFPFGAEATAANQDQEKLKFTGHERDAASVDYMHARYYGPNWGRFLSVDPVVRYEARLLPQGWNRYTYAQNNPIKFLDPDGEETKIALGLRTASNPVGHVALIINDKVYSFGTNWTKGPEGVKDWGRDAQAYLAAQNDLRQTELLTLDITPEQERKLQQHLDANNPNAPGAPGYNDVMNNCTTVTQDALVQSGTMPARGNAMPLPHATPVVTMGSATLPGTVAVYAQGANLVKKREVVGKPPKVGFFRSIWNAIFDKVR